MQYVSPLVYDAAYPVALVNQHEMIELLAVCGYELEYGWDMPSNIYVELSADGCYQKVPIRGFF